MDPKIVVKFGDIAKSTADVIINAANSQLQHGGGVAAALAKAAGPVLQNESDELIKSHGPVQVGECVVTSAGRLKAKHVIHTVGPTNEQHQEDTGLLYKAITNALNTASELKAKTVAMPLISAGKCSGSAIIKILSINLGKGREERSLLFNPTCARLFSVVTVCI